MSIAVGIFCKTPSPGASKTRLSPPLTPEQCAALSACFIRDLATTIADVGTDADIVPYAIYTPAGSEAALRALLPPVFRLLLQAEGDFTARVIAATRALLASHDGVILVNSDSPTLPASILRDAVDATRRGGLVLSPALDGGYTLIGVSALHEQLYRGIPWSTPQVYAATLARAAEIGLPATNVPGWYDVDDAQSLALLRAELAGESLPFSHGVSGARAGNTRHYLATL